LKLLGFFANSVDVVVAETWLIDHRSITSAKN